MNRFLQFWFGSKELLQQYKVLKKNVKKEINSIKILEFYYDSNVKFDQFNAIETFETFLIYFKMKEEHFGNSYKSESLNSANILLNKVKEAHKKYFEL